MPNRSRARTSARACASHHASANMPRTCASAAGPSQRQQPQQHFGVAAGREALAARFERPPQLAVVVDLAVEHDLVAAVGRRHRLRAGRTGIDDRQTGVHQQRVLRRRAPHAAAVRTAVRERGDRAPPTDPARSRRRGAPHRQCRTSEEPRLHFDFVVRQDLVFHLGGDLDRSCRSRVRMIVMRRSEPRSDSPPARMIACATVVPVSSTNEPGFLMKPEM